MLTRVLVLLALLTPLASAQQNVLPLISDVVDNAAGSQITINGSGFGRATPAVNLAGTSLTVVKYSDTQIVAAVPSSVVPGAYLLFVTNGVTHLPGVFDAQVGPAIGPAGLVGPQGAPGAVGPQGATGLAGARGLQGPQGPAGSQGATGATGPVGPAGLTGPAGPQGPAGANGAAGAQGSVGPAGATGAQGPQGYEGSPGATGPAGPTGPQGASPDVQLWTASLIFPSQSSLPDYGSPLYGLPLGMSNLQLAAAPPISSVLLAPSNCTASNFSASLPVGVNTSGAALVVNGVGVISCQIPNVATSCTSTGTAPIAAGSQVSILFNAVNDSYLPANQPLYVSFTCQ
jgi:hypothetical protein